MAGEKNPKKTAQVTGPVGRNTDKPAKAIAPGHENTKQLKRSAPSAEKPSAKKPRIFRTATVDKGNPPSKQVAWRRFEDKVNDTEKRDTLEAIDYIGIIKVAGEDESSISGTLLKKFDEWVALGGAIRATKVDEWRKFARQLGMKTRWADPSLAMDEAFSVVKLELKDPYNRGKKVSVGGTPYAPQKDDLLEHERADFKHEGAPIANHRDDIGLLRDCSDMMLAGKSNIIKSFMTDLKVAVSLSIGSKNWGKDMKVKDDMDLDDVTVPGIKQQPETSKKVANVAVPEIKQKLNNSESAIKAAILKIEQQLKALKKTVESTVGSSVLHSGDMDISEPSSGKEDSGEEDSLPRMMWFPVMMNTDPIAK